MAAERTIKKIVIIFPLYGYLLVPILIIGFAGILVFRDNPLSSPDDVLLELTVNAANFSPWIIGIMLSGALAAAMSTGANLAHTASTVLVRDLFVNGELITVNPENELAQAVTVRGNEISAVAPQR